MASFALNYKCDKQQIVNLENFCILTTEVKYNDLQAKQLLLLSYSLHINTDGSLYLNHFTD